MKELIKITKQGNKEVVSARELHAFLENTDNVNTWFKRQAERAMLTENEDFTCLAFLQPSGQSAQDYALTLSSAKEIAMLNGGDKGKQARLYFIECEKQLMTPKVPTLLEQTRLLLQSLEENEALKAQSLLDKPKVDFYNEVADTTSSFDFQDVSAMLKLKYGRNTLFKKLREASILMSDNLPYREHIDSERFIVVETKWVNPKNQAVTAIKQTRITQKGLDWLQKNKDKFAL
jgi:anti-repressor protein